MSRTSLRGERAALVAVLSSTWIACQAAPPASVDAVQATASPASAEPAEPAAPTAAPASVSAAASPSPSPSPPDTRVRDACAKLCERKATACPNHQAEACEAECAGHEASSKGCEAEVEAALSCQVGAKQTPCSNVAAGACTDAFLQMQRCKRGETSSPRAAQKAALPDGWTEITDETWGVTMALPPGAQLDGQAPSRTWKASFEGAEYEVRELARPKELKENDLIKLVIAHVGVSCQKEMRLTGRVELEHLLLTQYETGCSKSERLFGKLRIDPHRALSLLVRGPASTEHRRVFLEGLR